jgi:DNA-binding transcriptional LysR family regulator
MNLNLNQLRAFYFVARHGSISLAAERLFVSQPAVSMQIKSLEHQYGVLLFGRKKRGLVLTEAGRKLFAMAERIFALVEEVESFLDDSSEVATGLLRIGSTKTLVRHFLAEYISEFREAHPQVHIQLDEGSSEEMISSVFEGKNDFAITGRLHYPDKLQVIHVRQDEVVLLVPPGHRFCGREKVSIMELGGENLILREKGSGTRRVVDEAFLEVGRPLKPYIETGNIEFIKELVRQGKGITFITRMSLDTALEALVEVPLQEGPFMLDTDIVINKERRLSRADRAFLAVLFKNAVDRDAISLPNNLLLQ